MACRQIHVLREFISKLLFCELIKKVKAIHLIVTNSNTLSIKENQNGNINYRYSCVLDDVEKKLGKFPLFIPYSKLPKLAY